MLPTIGGYYTPALGIGGEVDEQERRGYTPGMKTAVSIPDDIFEKAERFAKRANRSRSDVFAAALREYVSRHSPDEITDAMNRVCSQLGPQRDEFVNVAGRRLLRKTQW